MTVLKGTLTIKRELPEAQVDIQASNRTFRERFGVLTPGSIRLMAVTVNIEEPTYQWSYFDDELEGWVDFSGALSKLKDWTVVPGDWNARWFRVTVKSATLKDPISARIMIDKVEEDIESLISKARHIGGEVILSQASMKCIDVVDVIDGYLCYIQRGKEGEIVNEFVVGDQAYCRVSNGSRTKYYWRLVTEVAEGYIKLSMTEKDGDGIPAAGDDIHQLGYQGKDLNHVKRLNAQVISESGISQYVEIDSFTLEGKRRNFISADGSGSEFTGKVTFKNAGEDYDLSDWAHETETAIQDAETTIQEAVDKIAPPVWLVQAVNIIPNAPTAIFRRGKDEALHQLTLVPKFTRDGVDVTDIMNQSGLRLYEFERSNMWGEDDKGILDSDWNLANKGRTQITLTHEDIVFIGNINMVFHSELLEQEYQLLK